MSAFAARLMLESKEVQKCKQNSTSHLLTHVSCVSDNDNDVSNEGGEKAQDV